MTLTPRLLAAWTAPSTSDLGALSPPIASTAMVTIWGSVSLLSDFDYFTALVLPTVRAHALHRERPQPLFLTVILQLAAAASIKRELHFAIVDIRLCPAGDPRGGPVIQIERAFEGELRTLQAEVAW